MTDVGSEAKSDLNWPMMTTTTVTSPYAERLDVSAVPDTRTLHHIQTQTSYARLYREAIPPVACALTLPTAGRSCAPSHLFCPDVIPAQPRPSPPSTCQTGGVRTLHTRPLRWIDCKVRFLSFQGASEPF
jgi:hypothetical protein